MPGAIHILPVSPQPPALATLDALAASLARLLAAPCRIVRQPFDAEFALDSIRGQLYSTAILARLAEAPIPDGDVILGITGADLYVPVLTFVFGEAQYPGRAAIVGAARLREEFYGLPADEEKFSLRLLKEAVHEYGHTRGLSHCDDWNCVMASSHRVERLDVKSADFCVRCKARLKAA